MCNHVPDEGQEFLIYESIKGSIMDAIQMIAMALCPALAVGFNRWTPSACKSYQYRTQRHCFTDCRCGIFRVVLAVFGVPVCGISDSVDISLMLLSRSLRYRREVLPPGLGGWEDGHASVPPEARVSGGSCRGTGGAGGGAP